MTGLLLRKQLADIFRTYLYDPVRKTARTRAGTILCFVFFFLLLGGFLGVFFGGVARKLSPLLAAGRGWLFFALLGLLAVFVGVFGSTFNTYTSVFLTPDDDLLRALPLRADAVVLSRMLSVFVLGLLYSATVTVPAVIRGALTGGGSLPGSLVWLLLIALLVHALSCALGWVVAQITARLRNKSLVTAFVALVFIAVYLFFFFKGDALIERIVAAPDGFAAGLRAALVPYLFGLAAMGDGRSAAILFASAALLGVLCWLALRRGFVRRSDAAGLPAEETRFSRAFHTVRSPERALLGKELRRFTASGLYMMNCGLGTVLLVAGGVVLLVKGAALAEVLPQTFGGHPGTMAALVCTAVCMIVSSNNMAAPSVSLEGRQLWILRSLPVTARQILRAKLAMQLRLTLLPALFCGLCAAIALPLTLGERLMLLLVPAVYALFTACFALFMGLHRPNLAWRHELVPIRQSGSVVATLLVGCTYTLALGGLYLWIGWRLGSVPYFALFAALTLALAALLLRWIDRRGAAVFDAL